MANKTLFCTIVLLLNLVPLLVLSADTFSRSEFPLPPDFVFGSGTFAYQHHSTVSGVWFMCGCSIKSHAGRCPTQGGNRLTDSPSPGQDLSDLSLMDEDLSTQLA
ncbi:hypothetical protein RHGRI_035839 [Rhododendron griersonianum]|uniref:Uncharacterized protein n=1 Tax=Rhododendron griersonianum TaxID=479676 RepID=A0AAV6HRD3_9ERIC|nr:hypothetical protein RHGRI_035839 [Rhododendron griersonianum]